VAAAMKKIPNPVRLEGHSDSMPIRTPRFGSNWELSAARGIALMEILSDRFGVPQERLSIAGYADTAPIASNDTAEGRARNRRVDIVLLNEQGADRRAAKDGRSQIAGIGPLLVSGDLRRVRQVC
jgi:chemotaxis protein MotB